MGLRNFIKTGYYSKVSSLSLDLDANAISFSMRTLSNQGGVDVISPIDFNVQKELAIDEYYKSNPPVLPPEIEYPTICSEREAMVPMWTTETEAEKAPYYEAKQQYEDELEVYNTLVSDAEQAARQAARVNNDYSIFFSRVKLFKDGNPLRCAYLYIKSRGSFSEVSDDETE